MADPRRRLCGETAVSGGIRFMRAIHRLTSTLRDSSVLRDTLKDTGANVMPIAAAGMMVAVALVGSGVDMSRAYMTKSRLQAACDAGVLAGRRAVISNGFDAPAVANAEKYFKANFNDTQQNTHDTVFTATSGDEGKTINGTATSQVDTAVMRVFAFSKFDLKVNCSSTMGVGNSDIVMVLDTTGSMGSKATSTDTMTKIAGLRTAMKNFYDTVEKSTDGSNARVRYGFVPYSSSVNVGKLIYKQNPNYLVDYWEYQTRIPVYTTVSAENDQYTPPFDSYETTYTADGADPYVLRYDSATTYADTKAGRKACDAQFATLNLGAQWSNVEDLPIGDPVTKIEGRKRRTTTTLSSTRQAKPVYQCSSGQIDGVKKWYVTYYKTYQTVNQLRYDDEYALQTNTSHGPFDHWSYQKWGVDVRTYKGGGVTSVVNGNSATSVNYTWKGCIEERSSVNTDTFNFSPVTGISPSQAYDLNIDKIPSISDDNTKWAPMWPEIAYLRGTYSNSTFRIGSASESSEGSLAGSYCPAESQLLTTMTKDTFYAYADKLKAEGSTYHDLGIIWGGRLASPDGIFASNVGETPQNGGAVSRHMIFMTDGIMDPSNTIQSSYGIEYYDHRVTENGSSGDDARHISRFLAVCEAVKAKGIRLWVIAFGVSMTTDLQQCASDESAFTAADAGSLNSAFQEIAKQVGELRVSQ